MGQMVTVIARRDDPPVSRTSNPLRPEWITAHASATGLSIVEVERLWLRFQQLGCTPDGVLTDGQIKGRNTVIGDNTFLRNIMTKLKDNTGPDGVVSFQAFINTMYWIEVATPEEKLRASFYLLNNGRPLTEQLVRQVFSKIYPNETEQGLDRLTKSIFEVTGVQSDSGDGLEIREDSYMNFARRVVPPPLLDSIFDFHIVPPRVTAEAKLLVEQDKEAKGKHRGKIGTPRSAVPDDARAADVQKPLRVEMSYQIPTSGQLEQVADQIFRRDFRLVGNKLGFFESDMNHVENMYPGDRRQQIMYLLHEWRKREGARAYTIVLQRALQEAYMSDVASMLQPGPDTSRRR